MNQRLRIIYDYEYRLKIIRQTVTYKYSLKC